MIKYALFILLFLVILAFLWWNREHPKVQETIIVIIATVGGAVVFLFLSGEAKQITRTISAVYFISNKENRPLFFTAPILTQYYLQQNVIYGEFAKNKTEKQEPIIIDNHRLFCDLQAATALSP